MNNTPESNEINTISILKEYSSEQWLNWIEDILYYGIALPFNKLTAEGDVLEDAALLLRSRNISTNTYEIALKDVLNKLYGNYNDPEKIIRVLDVLISIKSPVAKRLFITMFFDLQLKSLYFNVESVKAKVLQALARLDLEDLDRAKLDVYFTDYPGIKKEFSNNIALMGNYLRFKYLQFTEIEFLDSIERTMELNFDIYPDEKFPFVVTIIEDKIRMFF